MFYGLHDVCLEVGSPGMESFGTESCFMPCIFETELWVPRQREEVFAFFSDASNLEMLTPPWLSFSILTPQPIAMRAGALIDYRLRLHGIGLRWQTEITVWDPPHRFVDEQRRGPYRRWVHEHRFETRNGGTVVRDRVEYVVLGGWVFNRLFVRRDVERIFEFRRAKLLDLFGS
jgi:ligand-binding SRPBCC domain-containing protein